MPMMTPTELREAETRIRSAIQALQAKQWNEGYSPARVAQITSLNMMLRKILSQIRGF